jgi:hypothetical protein
MAKLGSASYGRPEAPPRPGTATGIPGASYPVLGSLPATNAQPRYGSPGNAQIQPSEAPAPMAPQGGPQPVANPQLMGHQLMNMGGLRG